MVRNLDKERERLEFSGLERERLGFSGLEREREN